ncbi:ubiquinol-cytochrome c reductase iron-sulfur subunit [Conexibacter sp. JD483]|uniref:QcrA and Rieske domain-containing protein n=1 Tax=unclassified Conexibacter TaxID=2627773 RepID=UPI002716B4A8|nr:MULTISPECIES: ubiquinol-cytochrome c reductase iron-sulfur subunit [unclassified Conexibacter]MDO8184423.1 ubiquinol-cytochrome c reductase iron-sulfur subunit [Conexibacter sp. CPCC 205706]MDO8197729.1 ubiquinol-cytochrome c reductase iron-sulfur subunit [Conexibacter sp. CPCC 205762]MDR9368135.1 ubiquinol-cytochrome c reductase iron-sulfur subunit [Conexibacter sp. JD483]
MSDKHKKSSPYTADRGIPGAFEGETVTRRRFMNVTAQGLGGVAVAAFALPALGFALGPVFERTKMQWQDIGPLSDFNEDEYIPKVFTIVNGIGTAGETTAYVRLRNPEIDTEPEDEYNRVIAISTRCNHLGCPVRFTPAAGRFLCPCHGGVYDFRGLRAGGPPVRPLDRFYTRIEDSRVLVGARYSVNSELKRFSPRDPGQPVDGIGQYLYPARFSTPEK